MLTVTEGNTLITLPLPPRRETTCAGATLVTLDGETLPAMAWAARRGLKW